MSRVIRHDTIRFETKRLTCALKLTDRWLIYRMEPKIEKDEWQSPAWARRHSVVLDRKLVPLHNTCQRLPADVHAVRLAVSANANIQGVGKNSPTVLSRFWTNVHQIWELCWGVPVDLLISFRLLMSCSVVEICSVKVQSRSQKASFALSPWGGGVNAPGVRTKFFQIAGISEYVSQRGWNAFGDLRD